MIIYLVQVLNLIFWSRPVSKQMDQAELYTITEYICIVIIKLRIV